METNHGEKSEDLFQAQSHLYHHLFNFIDSMSLKCAIELGIPDAIHSHKKPITLPELASALRVHPSRVTSLGRLMRVLVHSGIFAITEADQGQAAYASTATSRLLVRDNLACLSPFIVAMVDPALIRPWHCLGEWLTGSGTDGSGNQSWKTPLEAAHGVDIWGLGRQVPEFNDTFNRAMTSDSGMLNLVIGEFRDVFNGLESLVDVGGGTGTVARIINGEFPGIKCTVLDLPQVVEGLQGDCDSLKFVGGDMFEDIPPADAVLLKLMLHALSDEDCVKVLKKCKDAIGGRNGKGKVIIIDIVITDKDEEESARAKLYFDLLMMTVVGGKERTEKEWQQLFLDAGFSHYQIRPIFGLRSLIQVYPSE